MKSIARRALLAAVLAALGLAAAPVAADDWGQRVAGRHVYDTAGALAPAQAGDVEAAAAAVDRAGAPTVVSLRSKSADDAGTHPDARELMDALAVGSSPGAKDGFVLLLNLKPGDLRHGSAALVAGASHADSGRLSADRLQAVYDRAMKPHLAGGDLAGALAAALSDVAGDLAEQRPAASPPAPQGTSGGVVAGALLGGGAVVAAVLALLFLLARSGGRSSGGGGGPRRRAWGDSTSSSSSGRSFTGGDGGASSGGASSGSSSGGGSF